MPKPSSLRRRKRSRRVQWDEKYQGIFNVVPSFGLEQGTDESVDDHSACRNNGVSHRMQKVPMTMVDYIGALIKYFAKYTEDEIELTSEEMKGAYRQIALSPDNVNTPSPRCSTRGRKRFFCTRCMDSHSERVMPSRTFVE